MSVTETALKRYTTKAFDASKSVPAAAIEDLLTMLRMSPSSVNSQPWHFVLASDAAGKARIAKAAQGAFAYNEQKVLNASHVLVLAALTSMPEAHLDAVLQKEQADGRFVTPEAMEGQRKSRGLYVDLHRYEQKDLQHWMEKQVYLALGTLLTGAALLGLDATPMEGFDFRALDEELGLRAKGFTSVVLVSLGYRSDGDFNAKLPKSRLPEANTLTRI